MKTSKVLVATTNMAQWADDAWQSAQEYPTLASLNYAQGLARACAIASRELGGDWIRWEDRTTEISKAIRNL